MPALKPFHTQFDIGDDWCESLVFFNYIADQGVKLGYDAGNHTGEEGVQAWREAAKCHGPKQ